MVSAREHRYITFRRGARRRATRRHGSSADSMITRPDIFDCALRAARRIDRHFDDAAAGGPASQVSLDLKGVAVRDDAVERQRAPAARAPAAEAARAVVHRQPRDGADVPVRERCSAACGAPASCRSAPPGHVARADDEVGAARRPPAAVGVSAGSCEKSASIWQMCVASVRSAAAHAVDVRAAQARAALCGACTGPGRRCAAASASAIVAGPVRRGVVHDEHPQSGDAQQRGDERRQVVALVVGRNDDERPHRAVRLRPSTARRSAARRSAPRPGRRGTRSPRTGSAARRRWGSGRRSRSSPGRRPRRAANDATLIGTKMRSGLKIVMTFSRIRKNLAPSLREADLRAARCARRASIGSNATL